MKDINEVPEGRPYGIFKLSYKTISFGIARSLSEVEATKHNGCKHKEKNKHFNVLIGKNINRWP